MRKQSLLAWFSLFMAIFVISCKKETGINTLSFLGQWKTSYGDTISFARIGAKYMLHYDVSGSAPVPASSNYEYTYRDNKLGIMDGFSALFGFRFLQSFRWLEEGRSFEVQGVEWFPFMSSTSTYFTFTKIR